MTEKEFEKKKKDFNDWAGERAKYYFQRKAIYGNRSDIINQPISEYFQECIKCYSKERLMSQFNYTEEQYNQIMDFYNECFWKEFNYWQKRFNEAESVIEKYNPIFKEAEKVAKKVNVSDIHDGFPCGQAHLYLDPSRKDTELGKALALINSDSDSDPYTYELPITLPSYGQCVSFDEKICEKVKDFLKEKGIPALVDIFID